MCIRDRFTNGLGKANCRGHLELAAVAAVVGGNMRYSAGWYLTIAYSDLKQSNSRPSYILSDVATLCRLSTQVIPKIMSMRARQFIVGKTFNEIKHVVRHPVG